MLFRSRGLKEMQDYADTHPELKNGYPDYFRYGNGNRVCHHITTGRVSPWVIYNCDSGVAFLEKLDQGLLGVVMPWIDPDYWSGKFRDYVGDVEWSRHVLKEAGL